MSTSSKPTRFGYKIAVITAVGFAGFAVWPYLSHAAEKLADGKPVTVEEVKKEVEKTGKAKEKKDEKGKPFEPKSVLSLADGSLLVGGKPGLQEWRDGKLTPVAGFDGEEARSLATSKDGSIWAASKDGLWKRTGADWKNVKEGDFWGVSVGADGALFLAGKTGVFRSGDGVKWEPLKGTETGWKAEEKHEKKGGDKPEDYKG